LPEIQYVVPELKESINRLTYDWQTMELRVVADRLTDSGTGELWFYHTNSSGDSLLHVAKVNLLASSTMTQLAKYMGTLATDLPWKQIITFLSKSSIEYQRRGEPGIVLEPDMENLKHPGYYIEPLILKGVPNIIFGQKGVSKTTLALACAGLIHLGVDYTEWGFSAPEQANVAIIDYESTAQLTRYNIGKLIKGGSIPWTVLPYIRCKQPMADDIDRIGNFLFDNNTEVIIIDSLGQAAGADRNDSAGKGSALRFFEALRQLNLTSLIIGQTSKSEDNSRRTIYGCYSSDTEVLTDKGWKHHAEISYEDNIVCYDKISDCLRWEKPLRIWEYDYNGEMVNIKTASTDILVTPNHNILAKPLNGNSNLWQLIDASSLPYLFKIIHGAVLKERGSRSGRKPQYFKLGYKCKRLPMKDWLTFIGYWISEGNINPVTHLISLTQTENETLNNMKRTLDNLGFIYSDTMRLPKERREGKWQGNRKICHTLTLKNNCGEKQNNNKYNDGSRRKNKGVRKLLAQWLVDNCGENKYVKHLPSLVWTLNRREMKVLLDALLEGDGSQINEYNFNYYTASPQLADDVQKLAILIGYSTILRSRIREGLFLTYEVGITKKTRQLTIKKRKHISTLKYSGKVYCLTVPTNVYVTRRNGKMAIQGNSTYFTYYSRNIFELQSKEDEINHNILHTLLTHTDANYSAKHSPIGLSFIHSDDSIAIESEIVSMSEWYAKASQTTHLRDVLKNGAMSVKNLALDMGISENSCRVILSRAKKKSMVVEVSRGVWGLRVQDSF